MSQPPTPDEFHDVERLIELLVGQTASIPLPVSRQADKEVFEKVIALVKSHGQDVLKPLAELNWVFGCAAMEIMLTHMMVITMRSGRFDPEEILRLMSHNVVVRIQNMQTILSAPQGRG